MSRTFHNSSLLSFLGSIFLIFFYTKKEAIKMGKEDLMSSIKSTKAESLKAKKILQDVHKKELEYVNSIIIYQHGFTKETIAIIKHVDFLKDTVTVTTRSGLEECHTLSNLEKFYIVDKKELLRRYSENLV